MPEPGSIYMISTLIFVKGNVIGQILVWENAAPTSEIAKTAVK